MYASKLATGGARSTPWLKLMMCCRPRPAALPQPGVSGQCGRGTIALGECGAEAVSQGARPLRDEEDAGDSRRAGEDRLMMPLCPPLIFVLVQLAGPGVEQLVDVGSAPDQRPQEVHRRLLQPLEKPIPGGRLLTHERP